MTTCVLSPRAWQKSLELTSEASPLTAEARGWSGGRVAVTLRVMDKPVTASSSYLGMLVAVDVSGLGGERWWLTASFKPLRR